jgi:hypothetical protein
MPPRKSRNSSASLEEPVDVKKAKRDNFVPIPFPSSDDEDEDDGDFKVSLNISTIISFVKFVATEIWGRINPLLGQNELYAKQQLIVRKKEE